MGTLQKHFYLFKGDWYERFIDILEMADDEHLRFVIWEPQDRTKNYNVIVVYGNELKESYCLDHHIWKTTEEVFDSFYKRKIELYHLHGNFNSVEETEDCMFFFEKPFSEN